MELIDVVSTVLSVIGGSAVAAAWIPVKYQKHFKVAKVVLDIVAQNYRHAKNSGK